MTNGTRLDDVVQRYDGNPILTEYSVPWKADSIFNAGAIKHDGRYLLLARVQNDSCISELAVAESSDGFNFTVRNKPDITPNQEIDKKGVEDPRIVRIDGEFLITHTSYSQYGPCVGLTTTKDFVNFERRGPIIHTGTKNAVLHPEKVNGEFLLYHRPMSDENIWISFSKDLEYWKTSPEPFLPVVGKHRELWYENRIGSGAVPIRTDEGWLHIIHGVQGANVYRLGVALFDLENPLQLRGISKTFILHPREDYETVGLVDNVVFTCGAIPEDDGTVKIYYGGADKCIGLATAKINDLVDIALNK